MRAAGDGMTLAQVRAGIDRVDAALVALLAERAAWIDRAAEVKAREGLPARISWRVEEVVANVRRHAEAQGLSPVLVEMLWRELIGWSIAREEALLGPGGSAGAGEGASGGSGKGRAQGGGGDQGGRGK